MGTTKFYQQLLRQQLAKAEQKKTQQVKELPMSKKVMLTQPLNLINYVDPPEHWLKSSGSKKSVWTETLTELKYRVGLKEFTELVNKYVKTAKARKAIFEYIV